MRFLPKITYGVLFGFSKKRTRQTVTVEELAKLARRKLIRELGEAGFARACLAFDKQLEATCPNLTYANSPLHLHTEYARPVASKAVLAARQVNLVGNLQEPEQQLALIWLAGHGWGHLRLSHLLEQ